MKKLVILFLSALVQNLPYSFNIYDFSRMEHLYDNKYILKVKTGEEFWISLFGNTSTGEVYDKLLNYLHIPYELEYFGNNGNATEIEPYYGNNRYPLKGVYLYYYKFKAHEPSYNRVFLQFGGGNKQIIIYVYIF